MALRALQRTQRAGIADMIVHVFSNDRLATAQPASGLLDQGFLLLSMIHPFFHAVDDTSEGL